MFNLGMLTRIITLLFCKYVELKSVVDAGQNFQYLCALPYETLGAALKHKELIF